MHVNGAKMGVSFFLEKSEQVIFSSKMLSKKKKTYAPQESNGPPLTIGYAF